MPTPGSRLDGRTAIVTGAGDGLGRAEALGLAAAGAAVVVNDIGPTAQEVVDEITAAGGRATAVVGDVGQWELGTTLVEAALDHFGSLDILVNNAGVVRDKMIFNLTEADWDDVIRVHLKGHASTIRAAAVHWRQLHKKSGSPADARIINTSSEAFLFGAPGQPNYSAAKSGITALTLSAAQGLSRYGVRTNAICPRARTQMTREAFGPAAPDTAPVDDPLSPAHVARLVTHLASPAAHEINGQVFVVYGRMVALLAPPTVEHLFEAAGPAFDQVELATQLTDYFAGREQTATFAAYGVADLARHAAASESRVNA